MRNIHIGHLPTFPLPRDVADLMNVLKVVGTRDEADGQSYFEVVVNSPRRFRTRMRSKDAASEFLFPNDVLLNPRADLPSFTESDYFGDPHQL